jgi:hypothetical protein
MIAQASVQPNSSDQQQGGVPPTATPVPVAIPVYAQSSQPYGYDNAYGQPTSAYPIYGGTYAGPQATAYAEAPTPVIHIVTIPDNLNQMLSAYAMARNIKFLALIDGTFLIILSIFNVLWFLFLWGPVCGYVGSVRYSLTFVNVYICYYILRVLGDLLLALLGYWWYFFALVLDIFILRYVWYFRRLLVPLSPEQINQLLQPEFQVTMRNAADRDDA